MTFYLKRNDTSPSLLRQLLDGAGSPIPLFGCTVVFNMWDESDQVIISRRACTVTDATNGWVRHDWLPADTISQGTFRGEFEITFASGAVETVPNSSYIEILITRDIA